MPEQRPVILTCGVVADEVAWLVQQAAFDAELVCLDSALHMSFEKLYIAVGDALATLEDRPVALVYGACHPRIDALLEGRPAARTRATNCCEMLLGEKRFRDGLEAGEFFMLFDWARRWEELLVPVMGDRRGLREVFTYCHKQIVALTTPCSPGYAEEARRFAEAAGLPLRFEHVELHQLRQLIDVALDQARRSEHGHG